MNNYSAKKSKRQIVRTDALVCILLIVTILAVYWQVTKHEFVVYDDRTYITDNRYVREGLTLDGLHWAFSFQNKDKTYWHPLTWLSHMLDVQLYGTHAGSHLFVNVLFHIASSLLLFYVLRRMTGAMWLSAIVSAIFAVHPMNVESVAWVAARKNVLSTFFWMLTILLYIRNSERPATVRYLLVLGSFALGLMAKPMLVTLPFVLLLLDFWPLNRFQLSNSGEKDASILRLLLEKSPLFLLSAVSIWLSSFSLHRFGDLVPAEAVPLSLRISNALVSYVVYIAKMMLPLNLTCYYPFPEQIPLWHVVGSACLLVAVSFACLKTFRHKPYLLIGWLWYLGTLVPVIGLVQAGLWPAIADRFVYVPYIGLYIIMAWGGADLVRKMLLNKTLIATAVGGILLIFIILSWSQTRYWKNSIVLFKHAVAVTTDNFLSHYALGFAYDQRGMPDKSIEHYSESLRINGDQVDVHFNLAIMLNRAGNSAGAIDHYREVLRLEPDDVQALNNLGNIFFRQGKLDEAIAQYRTILQYKPGYVKAYNNLGAAEVRKGNYRKAVVHFQKALTLNPDDPQTKKNLEKAQTLLNRQK